MNYEKIIGAVLNWGAIGFACWYCGFISATPNWRLYGAFTLVGVASRASGRIAGALDIAARLGSES